MRKTLSTAGDNRSELESVLDHYQRLGADQKLAAAQFLIGNMEGHGYVVTALYDAERNEIEFDALDYDNFNDALKALDQLEEEHGEIDFKRKRFDKDVEIITSDFLIENIDLAFEAWRNKPWARELTFEAFCEHILPYRGSNEPLDRWRYACMERYADLGDNLNNTSDPKVVSKYLQKDAHQWVGFSSLYYLHPTDQSFSEMDKHRLGRCEDITNMILYTMRANAVPSAADYTPFWADRDNNHAWEVYLDKNGEGRAGLSNRAAKVYRKVFSIQRNSLGAIKKKNEEVPRWLSGKNYLDVTSQYMETSDVCVHLETTKPKNARFAYICVFNGGEWQAIHWGEIKGKDVTFTDMGRNIAYLPAYYVDGELVQAAPPFILTSSGEVRTLKPDYTASMAIDIAETTPETPDADTKSARPVIAVKPGKTYELFICNHGWKSLGIQNAGEQPVSFTLIPTSGLYWLVEKDSRRLERIFTVEDGQQIWW